MQTLALISDANTYHFDTDTQNYLRIFRQDDLSMHEYVHLTEFNRKLISIHCGANDMRRLIALLDLLVISRVHAPPL